MAGAEADTPELCSEVSEALNALYADEVATQGELDARVLQALARVQPRTALLALQVLREACSAEDGINKKSAYLFKVLKKTHRDHHDSASGPLPSIFDGSVRREKKRARKESKMQKAGKEEQPAEPVVVRSAVEERQRQMKASKASRRRQRAKEKLRENGATPQVQKKRRREDSGNLEEQRVAKHAMLKEAAEQRLSHKSFVAIKSQVGTS
eukprot:TRINITY_DN28851_c0_g1_i1.p1 TRINITY_DN28851_c0_g1~~TRINITY_DN28851_c0_g1_i1.p1  ORF type:complete len:211 (-),score=53.65 TRINITY_DN28851_c0_g1_i1:129-761(-)